MSKGHFSVQVVCRDRPLVIVASDRDGCWLQLHTFSGGDYGCSALTVHLPDDPAALRELASELIVAADALEDGAIARARVATATVTGDAS